MDPLTGLAYGFEVVLRPENLLASFVGVVIGTLVGVLPGLGPIGTMALLLPISVGLEPATAVILLTGVFYGSMYGGSTTSILMKMPGEVASVITTLDGYEMTRQGRGGAALAIAAVSSFVAGTVSIIGLMLFAPALSNLAVQFSPVEYLALASVGVLAIVRLSSSPAPKALLMLLAGAALSTVGMGVNSGYTRFTLGFFPLTQGISLVPLAVGLFGVAEVLLAAEQKSGIVKVAKVRLRELFPSGAEWRRSVPSMLRGSGIGFAIGLIPGPVTVLASLAAYTAERLVSPFRAHLGKGAVEGVAAPEAANNSATGSALIPLLALGLPFAPATAMLLAALLLHGVGPGPLLLTDHPDVFWGVVASMYIGNFFLIVLNLPLVGLWISLLRTPRHLLLTVVVLAAVAGSYSVRNSPLDVVVLAVAGITGYFLAKLALDPVPLILGLVLGPILERSLTQSLVWAGGDVAQWLTRPASLIFVLGVVLFLGGPLIHPALSLARRAIRGRPAKRAGDRS